MLRRKKVPPGGSHVQLCALVPYYKGYCGSNVYLVEIHIMVLTTNSDIILSKYQPQT